MTFPVGQWIDLDPEPVPIDDPRVRTACLVADGAWVRSIAPTTSVKVRDVVRAVLAHVDDLARMEKEADVRSDQDVVRLALAKTEVEADVRTE